MSITANDCALRGTRFGQGLQGEPELAAETIRGYLNGVQATCLRNIIAVTKVTLARPDWLLESDPFNK